jgi:hypothetical protein
MLENRTFSIEAHGDKNFAIYSGRDISHHGYRLCNVNDFDMNGDRTIEIIDASLHAFELIINYSARKQINTAESEEIELAEIVRQVMNTFSKKANKQ